MQRVEEIRQCQYKSRSITALGAHSPALGADFVTADVVNLVLKPFAHLPYESVHKIVQRRLSHVHHVLPELCLVRVGLAVRNQRIYG